MRKNIFRAMAVTNIRKNHRFYVPYLLTVILTAAMFCNMCSISQNSAFTKNTSVNMVLGFGVDIIAVFSVVFIFYTNSFLMKRRKKELGLYHILGLEKRHIARILVWETVILAAVGILGGIAVGTLLDRLMFLVILKIYHYPVSVSYQVQPFAMRTTAVLFIGIFLLVLVWNIYQIRKSSAIELLKSQNTGEREPKAKWVLAIAGLLCMGIGYYLAITTDTVVSALGVFLIAVLLVIFGTYSLFLAGSIAFLKLLKKNKTYYYRTSHFVAVSGMLYRMKQNAVGLANICVLSTGVLLVISTTVSIYAGMKDIVIRRFPTEIHVEYDDSNDEENEELEKLISRIAKERNTELVNYRSYKKMEVTASMDGDRMGEEKPEAISDLEKMAAVSVITADTYEKLTGKKLSLQKKEVAVNSKKKEIPREFSLFGETYETVADLQDFPIRNSFEHVIPHWFNLVVSSEEELTEIYQHQEAFYEDAASKVDFHVYFDAGGEEESKDFFEQLKNTLHEEERKLPYMECRYLAQDEMYVTYGSMLFLGMYLGVLFLMATVLIIYYKQIIEGYEDRERYVIMRKVGMEKREVRRSIKSQILILFFMPLAMALIHCLAAFPLMSRILQGFNMYNVGLYGTVTAAVAAVFTAGYICVYALTARTYYHIVS